MAEMKRLDQQLLDEAMPCSLTPEEWQEQIYQEALEQWRAVYWYNRDWLEAYRHGDRIGLCYGEGGATFQPINEQRLEMALRSNQGSDETSIVDCFVKFAENYPPYTSREQFVWDWLSYHQLHHGTGYGSTYRDHFALVKFIKRHPNKYPDLDSRLDKLAEIAADADSFGNGVLALCYLAHCYAKAIGEEPAEFVLYLTSFTHTNADAIKAVTLLIDIIEGMEVDAPSEEFIRENCLAERATAYNTLLTALFIANAETEMEVIRRGVWVCGDTDSTLSTAMLLWKMRTDNNVGA